MKENLQNIFEVQKKQVIEKLIKEYNFLVNLKYNPPFIDIVKEMKY